MLPRPLTPAASINRVMLLGLPGARVDDEVRGKSAYDLVGSSAVFALIKAHAQALGLSGENLAAPRPEIFAAFDRCFEHSDPEIRRAAREVARRFGRNLGFVLVALRRPDAQREVRPEWDAFREHWQTLPCLWLGGGLIRGHLRDHLLDEIAAVFAETNTDPPALLLDAYGAALPLIGAACCAARGHESALALDFGGTNVKRGAAVYRDDALARMELLPALDSGWQGNIEDENALRAFLFDFMIPTVVESWSSAKPSCPVIPVSLAAYVDHDGQPFERQGAVYAGLRRITSNLQQTLTEEVARRVGQAVDVRLIHDGTAAATAHPGDAVLTLGTAIGAGYYPAVNNPLPLDGAFHLVI